VTGAVLAEADALALLTRGRMDLEGRLVEASNTTLRAEITLDGLTRRCVYKPVQGERPLWDFPDGTLAGREVSAYLVSQATGWDLVPPTILRDGPLGVGACQLWIDEPDETDALIGFVPAWVITQRRVALEASMSRPSISMVPWRSSSSASSSGRAGTPRYRR